MFWIAVAIVVVGYLWYTATTRKQALSGNVQGTQALDVSSLVRRDPVTFQARWANAVDSDNLPLAAAILDHEIRPALSDVARALRQLYEPELSLADRAARARSAQQTARHFGVVAKALEFVASQINGQQHQEPSHLEAMFLAIAQESFEIRAAQIIEGCTGVDALLDEMDLIRNDPPAFLRIARKILVGANALDFRLRMAEKDLRSVAGGFDRETEQAQLQAAGPFFNPATFRESFAMAFDSGDLEGAAEVVEQHVRPGLHRAIRRAVELHERINDAADEADTRKKADSAVDAADHALDVANALAMLSAAVAEKPKPKDFTIEEGRAIMERLRTLTTEDGWSAQALDSFLTMGKAWAVVLNAKEDLDAYAYASDRLRWQALECWIWAKVTRATLDPDAAA